MLAIKKYVSQLSNKLGGKVEEKKYIKSNKRHGCY